MSRTVDGTFGLTKNQPPTVTRPFDFGTDAIERQRVSLGQSIIDADFEYGLQATKWQTYQEIRKMPSFYEIPGTDIAVSSVTTDGGTSTSNITVNINTSLTSLLPSSFGTGNVISISGLSNSQRNADRAEGFFVVRNVTGNPVSSFTYESRAAVGTNGQTISTSYTVLRRGGVYTNSTSYLPFTSATGSSTTVTVSYPPGTSHGIAPGTPIQTANTATFTGLTPGENVIGSFVVTSTPSANTFTFTVPATVSGTQTNGTEGFRIYTSPYSYAIHRPFDGGVILSPGQPSFGASAMRQSKKVFRYQSGKGLLWSSGTLFCPNNDVTFANVANSNINVVCDVPHGSPQAGATIQLKGISTPGYNGTYTVSNIIDSRTLQVTPAVLPTVSPAVLGDQPRFVMNNWYGASVRAGCFEDQNGLFWEWDGQTLWAVKRSSTFQTAGYVTAVTGSQVINGDFSDTANFPTATISLSGVSITGGSPLPVGSSNVTLTGATVPASAIVGMQNQASTVSALFGSNVYISNVISGTSLTLSFPPTSVSITAAQIQALGGSVVFQYPNTRFIDQLRVNDKVVIRGMTHTIVQIQTQGTMIVNPPYRGASSITTPVKMCKVKEVRTPQSQFNRDTLDGTGPSGFKFDATKMQMIGLQYTWYGAGFVDFMMRGGDGNWVYAHRYKQNNINDEAYMRTGNMPVRYELINESTAASSALAVPLGTAETTLTLTEAPTYWPPSGNVMVDNELMSYTGKSGTTLTGVTRAASMRYIVNDSPYTLTASAAAQTHQAGSTALLVGTTCTPSLTHWGSAFIMDGQFDSDRGYFFNYSNTSTVQLTTGQSSNVFMIRLAPTVSNGIVGDMGQRELLNRAQLLLQKLEVIPGAASSTTSIVNVTGILNPSGINPASVSWSNVNSTVFGSQPSFTQIGILGALGANYINGTGERIFSTIAPSGAQNTIDLSSLKELSNTVIGGNGIFPDGPDTLMIQLTSVAGTVTNCNTNLFWTEAQA